MSNATETALDSERSHSQIHDVGILFVHGIGLQQRGETLTSLGAPLLSWLGRWLTQENLSINGGAIPEPLRLTGSHITEARLEPTTPAHASFELNLEISPEKVRTTSWLMAESWWASDFRTPPFSSVARWMLSTGAWVVLTHEALAGRTDTSLGRLRRIAASLILSVPVALLVQLVTLTIALAAVIPEPRLRRGLSQTLLWLTGVLGDAYVFTNLPLDADSAVGRVRSDLNWLSHRCRRIILVAHSQGAAIAHRALEIYDKPDVSLFVTVGSGLAKLSKLRMEFGERPWLDTARFQLEMAFAPFVFLTPRAVAIWMESLERGILKAHWLLLLFGMMPLAALVRVIVRALGFGPDRTRSLWFTNARRDRTKWVDYYSSADPVPNGPLPSSDTGNWVTGIPLTNRRSVLTDHTSYWTNPVFVASLIYDIDSIVDAGLSAVRGDDWSSGAWLKSMRERQHSRTRVLVVGRTVLAVGFVAAIASAWSNLPGFGRMVYSRASEFPFLGALASALRFVAAETARFSDAIGGAGQVFSGPIVPGLFGAAVVAFVSVGWYQVAFWSWSRWDAHWSAREVFGEEVSRSALSSVTLVMAATWFVPLAISAALVSGNFLSHWWARSSGAALVLSNVVILAGMALSIAALCRAVWIAWRGRYTIRIVPTKVRRVHTVTNHDVEEAQSASPANSRITNN